MLTGSYSTPGPADLQQDRRRTGSRFEGLDAEAVYLRLPIPLQNVACSLVGLRTERTRYADEFSKLLAQAVARTYWSTEEIRALRNRRVEELVEHTARTSRFYRERLRAAGVAPSEIRSVDDLSSLPILSKLEVQANMGDIFSTAIPSSATHLVHTSGTTGGALRFRTTMTAIQEQWATWWRYRDWHGIRRGTWCALFAGRSIAPSRQKRPPFWRVNYPGKQVLFSGYHVAPEHLSAYFRELRRRQLPWLHGYPSLLALLAAFLLDSGFDLGYQVQWITTGAENLLPHQAALIEDAFGIKPIQHYGLAESVANISQCELGNLHVDEDFAAVEFIPAGHEDLYRIVGTNLTNPATPLLRYDTGDMAVIREGSTCSCGRPGRIVERVDGRLEDYIVLRNNVRIGRMDHIFKDMVNVQEAQIHQARPGEITLRIVRGRRYGDSDEQALLRETSKRVGGDTDIRIEYRESLPRSSTGKLRFVVSELEWASIEESPLVRP